MKTTVTYPGFLQTITKTFSTKEEAETWLRKVGKFRHHGVKIVSQ